MGQDQCSSCSNDTSSDHDMLGHDGADVGEEQRRKDAALCGASDTTFAPLVTFVLLTSFFAYSSPCRNWCKASVNIHNAGSTAPRSGEDTKNWDQDWPALISTDTGCCVTTDILAYAVSLDPCGHPPCSGGCPHGNQAHSVFCPSPCGRNLPQCKWRFSEQCRSVEMQKRCCSQSDTKVPASRTAEPKNPRALKSARGRKPPHLN